LRNGDCGMKRFLIFALLFPGIAVAVFFAWFSMEMSMFPDNPQALFVVGWGYVVGVVPALVCAVVDLLLRKTRIPAVIGTTLVGYGIAILAGLTIFDWGLIGRILAFGLIGAIPAAVCSWLSNEKQNMGADA
jgi:FtsH-binding integral membrane protein